MLVVAHPVLCKAGREEPFDGLSAWMFSPTLAHTADFLCRVISGTPELPRNPGDGGSPENPIYASIREECSILPLSYRALWQEVDVVHVGLKTERRLDVAIFMPSEPSESAKLISLSKCPKTRTVAFFITFFMWTNVTENLFTWKIWEIPRAHADRATD